MFNAFLEPCYPRGIGTNGNRVVGAVALPGTIPLASPKVTDYSIRRQQVALLSSNFTLAQQQSGSQQRESQVGMQEPSRTAQAIRVEHPPKLDGTLDDPAWQKATPITNFLQREPFEG